MIALAIAAAAQAASLPMRVTQAGREVAGSPLGRARVVSRAAANPGLEWPDPRSMASIWLEYPGKAPRLLAHYARDGEVRWSGDGQFVIFRSIGAHLETLQIFAVAARSPALRHVEPQLEAAMRTKRSRLAVENRRFDLRRFDAAGFCARIEESGLPTGKRVGGFLTRKGAFRVGYSGKISPVATC